MLFSATEFEQYFTAKALKNGLKSFELGELLLQERRPDGNYTFLIANTVELHLKKTAEQIISYNCACRQQNYCMHLSAVLFYLQKDTLGLKVKKSKDKRINPFKIRIPTRANDFESFVNTVPHPELLDFVRAYASANGAFKNKLEDYYKNAAYEKTFTLYTLQLSAMLQPYASAEKLSQGQINAIHETILMFISQAALTPAFPETSNKLSSAKRQHTSANDLYYLHLAIVCELPLLFNARLLGDESSIVDTIYRSTLELVGFFENGLSHNAKESWLQATLQTGKYKNQTGTNVFTFLLPMALCFITQKQQTTQLKSLLSKRRLKTAAALQIDKIIVARLQIAITEAKLFSTPFPFKDYRATPEFVIAEAELKFCEGNTIQAFKLLENFYSELKDGQKMLLMPYTNYIILQARERALPLIEIKYLRESMVEGLHINPLHLERFLSLIPAENIDAETNELIVRIKTQAREFTLDKLSVLLLRNNRYNDLIAELKGYKNKFSLVHKIAMQILPHTETAMVHLYGQHLTDALTDGAYDHYHEQIFISAKKYLDLLPADTAAEIIHKVLNKLASFSGIYKFIKKQYPVAKSHRLIQLNKLRGEG